MFTLKSKYNRFKYLVFACAIFLVHYFFPIPQNFQILFFGLGVLLFGIPHGSLDHFIYHHHRKEVMTLRSIAHFLLFYLGFAILYSILWIISVELSILLFILISAYHFGEMDLKSMGLKANLGSKTLFSVYGFLFLINYLLFQFPQVEAILLGFPGFDNNQIQKLQILYNYQQEILIGSILLFFPILIVFLLLNKQLGFPQIEAMFQLALLMVIVFNLPILLGFGLYFNIWHAGLSMVEIKKFLGWQDKSYFFVYQKSWITNGASFLMIAILFFVFSGDLERLLAIFFMAIAILTAPHMKVISSFFSKGS